MSEVKINMLFDLIALFTFSLSAHSIRPRAGYNYVMPFGFEIHMDVMA